MALSKGMTALRAALGAVGGGLEGYAQFQAMEQKRKREEEAASLQREITRFNALQAAGARFELPRQTPDAAARPATALEMPEMPGPMTAAGQQSMLGRALQAGMGVSKAPTGGLDTPIQLALDTTRTRQFERGAAMQPAVPQERIRIGGLDLAVRAPETEEEKFARELKKYEAQVGVQQRIQDAAAQRSSERQRLIDDEKVKTLVLAGVPEAQARAGISMGAKFGDLMETPESRRRAEMDYRNLSLNERRYALEVAKYNQSEQDRATKVAEAQDKKQAAAEALKNVLPTITSANKTLRSWTDKELNQLSAEGVNAAMVANMSSTTPTGIATSWLLNKTLVSPLDREYAQYARATADAVARASEVGVLTNQDIARYQNQVTFVAGDDPATKRRKFEALKTWGSWLENNKKSLVDGNRRALPQIPGETPTEALARLRGGQ